MPSQTSFLSRPVAKRPDVSEVLNLNEVAETICTIFYDELGAICLVGYPNYEHSVPAISIRATFSRHFRIHRYALHWCLGISFDTGAVVWYPHYTQMAGTDHSALLIYPHEMSLSTLSHLAYSLAGIGKKAGPRMMWDDCALTAYYALRDFCLVYKGYHTDEAHEMGYLSLFPSESW